MTFFEYLEFFIKWFFYPALGVMSGIFYAKASYYKKLCDDMKELLNDRNFLDKYLCNRTDFEEKK